MREGGASKHGCCLQRAPADLTGALHFVGFTPGVAYATLRSMNEREHAAVYLGDHYLNLHPSVFVADNARLLGRVTIGEGSSVWYSSVLRADTEPIVIGRGCSIQEGAVLHVDPGKPCVLGDNVTVGHRAVVHGCQVGSNVIVGIGSVILSGAVVGDDCIIGAGAVVGEGKEIPPRSLVLGIPGKVVRELSPEQVERVIRNAENYVYYAARFKEHFR